MWNLFAVKENRETTRSILWHRVVKTPRGCITGPRSRRTITLYNLINGNCKRIDIYADQLHSICVQWTVYIKDGSTLSALINYWILVSIPSCADKFNWSEVNKKDHNNSLYLLDKLIHTFDFIIFSRRFWHALKCHGQKKNFFFLSPEFSHAYTGQLIKVSSQPNKHFRNAGKTQTEQSFFIDRHHRQVEIISIFFTLCPAKLLIIFKCTHVCLSLSITL